MYSPAQIAALAAGQAFAPFAPPSSAGTCASAFGAACSAWFDASDPATLTLASGAVSSWADKSGNGLALSQASAAARPAFSGGGVVFSGSESLSAAGLLADTGAQSTVCACVQNVAGGTLFAKAAGPLASVPAVTKLFFGDASSGGAVTDAAAAGRQPHVLGPTGGFDVASTPIASGDAPQVVCVSKTTAAGSASSSRRQLYLNGAASAALTTATGLNWGSIGTDLPQLYLYLGAAVPLDAQATASTPGFQGARARGGRGKPPKASTVLATHPVAFELYARRRPSAPAAGFKSADSRESVLLVGC